MVLSPVAFCVALLHTCSVAALVDNSGIAVNTLVTKSTLAKLLLKDPRTRALQDLEPVAFLLTGRGRLPLFSADKLDGLTQEKK
jgi:hypothetical protein